MYTENGVAIDEKMAGLMLSAILSDTLMFRSPTCTEVDKAAAEALAKLAGVDAEELALKMFEAGSDFSNKSDEEILNQDFKIFNSGDIAFGVAQVSAMSRADLDKVKVRLQAILDESIEKKKINMIFVMLTDILKESTYLIYGGENAKEIAAAGNSKHDDSIRRALIRVQRFRLS